MLDVLDRPRDVPGTRVAIIGAGGIGFDVAEFLVHDGAVADAGHRSAGCTNGASIRLRSARRARAGADPEPPAREVWLLQRSAGKPGARLGKTTGWIHRATLKAKGCRCSAASNTSASTMPACTIRIDGAEQAAAGRPRRDLRRAGTAARAAARAAAGASAIAVHVIGGADVAAELDAKRAIAQGTALAAKL